VTISNCLSVIKIAEGVFQVEAPIIAAGLEVDPDRVLFLMRTGEITSISEQGAGKDAGFHRLTFYYGNRRLRLIINERGQIIRRLVTDFGSVGRPDRKQK
jgi:hypothetical protein